LDKNRLIIWYPVLGKKLTPVSPYGTLQNITSGNSETAETDSIYCR